MNKAILISLSIIAAVGAIAVGGTIALQSGFEKSEGGTFAMNGFLFTIDSDCHFNGMDCVGDVWEGTSIPCACKWDAKDLTDEKFFDFVNLKPGDSGEVTISMHVEGDDYYVRSKVDNVLNKDNGCNEPETELGDVSCGDDGGELGANIGFAFWADMGSVWGYQGSGTDPKEGDNILNSGWEYFSLSKTRGDDSTGDWTYIIDPTTHEHQSFIDGSTYYMGAAWCIGDLSVVTTPDGDGVYAITCDGTSATSIIQTDSYSSDMTFEVIQATNNAPGNPWGI